MGWLVAKVAMMPFPTDRPLTHRVYSDDMHTSLHHYHKGVNSHKAMPESKEKSAGDKEVHSVPAL